MAAEPDAMKSIFEPLLHANAKAFAILGGVLFAGMLGWGGYTEYAARRDAEAAAQEAARRSEASLPVFPAPEPIGLLAYAESQTATGTEDAHLPVDLFRCPVDAEGNPVRPGATPVPLDGPAEVQDLFDRARPNRPPGGGNWGGNWGGNGGNGGNGGERPQRPPRNHELSYGGVFERDGVLAAWVYDRGEGKGMFVREGDVIGGATILGGNTKSLRIRLEDGTERELVRGGESVVTGTYPPEPAAEDASRQRRARRMPTEDEIREIEQRDPDLARRIREAVRRHNERQRNGN